MVTDVRCRADTVAVVDQLGQTHRYPADAIVPPAVRDPLVPSPAVLARIA